MLVKLKKHLVENERRIDYINKVSNTSLEDDTCFIASDIIDTVNLNK